MACGEDGTPKIKRRKATMTERKHTKDILADELMKAGLPQMAERAASGYYHDFLSPLATPCIQLAADLDAAAKTNSAAASLRKRHGNGEFDASKAEAEEWAQTPEGRALHEGVMAGRLSLREEGPEWVAYYAQADTMDDAIRLGSILIKFPMEHPKIKEAFIALMRDVVSTAIAEVTGGQGLTWGRPERSRDAGPKP
jgi:hypothetical protein